MSLLEINNDRMRYLIKNKKLEEELEIFGYKLVETKKEGRNSVFIIEPTELDLWLQYQAYRNIKKKEEHKIYVENRLTEKGFNSPRKSFVNNLIEETKIDISVSTARRYDVMMLEDEIMQKDEKMYLMFYPETNLFETITQEEYGEFWRECGEFKKQLGINKLRYNKRLISEKTYDSNNAIIHHLMSKNINRIAIQYDTYKEFTYTQRIIDAIKTHDSKQRSKL